MALTHPYSWPEVRRGAERIIVETARALAGRGHKVTILTSGATAGWRRDGDVTTIRVRRRFADASRHETWFAWRTVPFLVRGRFDAVHSLMPRDALAATRTRRLGGHRAVYEDMGIPDPGSWLRRPDRRARHHVARDVDVYACMSRFALRAYERAFGRGGALIPGGVRLDEFRPAPSRAERPTLLFSGALDEPRKGVNVLLDALGVLASERPDVRLWLSGPGDPSEVLATAPDVARARTDVLPLGEPADQAGRYAEAWVTVLPSTHESFGMVLLESLACGTPIVVTNHSAPPELVTPATGLVCEPNDPSSLAAALAAALDLSQKPETVDACRAFARRYDWDEALAPHLEELYAGVPVVEPATLR